MMWNPWLVLSFAAMTQCHSPAIMWPADQFALADGQSALETMSLEDFQKMFQDKKVVVFHKYSFTIENVAYPSKPIHYLQTVDAIALQNIKSAHRMLASLTESDSVKIVQLDNGNLADQDQLIKDTMEANPGFAGILIGLGSGSQRSRRAADDKSKAACEKRGTSEKCIAYVAAVKVGASGTGKCEIHCPEEKSLTIEVQDNNDTAIATIKVVEHSGGYQLSVDGDQYKFDVDAKSTWTPYSFSFSCAELKLIPTAKNTQKDVYFLSGLQLWPKAGKETFGDSFDCSTWFTPQLWMGFLISLFYSAILFVAILFLLDVKTNDRFDDPKGKTITVNVSE